MHTKTDKIFVRYVQNHLREYKFRLIWGKGKTVNVDGYRSQAYFCEQEKVIKIAKNNKSSFKNLVHEYAHFLQWLDSDPLFIKSDKAIEIIDNWFAGKNYSQKELQNAFRVVREMERDCEMRSAELIQKWGLSINVKNYIKDANIYIYLHYAMEKKRKFWSFKKNPYKSLKLRQFVANNFKVKSHTHCPPKIMKQLLKLTNHR